MPAPRLVVPTPHVANTFGILNIIFGSLIFLYSLTTLSSLLMAPLFRRPTEAMSAAYKEAAEKDHKALLAEIKALEASAETDEERAVYGRRFREVEADGPASLAAMELMALGFQEPTVIAWSWLDSTTSLIVNLLMVASGAGLIWMRDWGRRLGIWVAWIKIVRLLVVWGGLWVLIVTPRLAQSFGQSVESMIQQQQAASGGGGPLPFSFTTLYAVTYSIMGVMMVVFGAIYPIACLVALNKPGVRAACRDAEPAASGMVA